MKREVRMGILALFFFFYVFGIYILRERRITMSKLERDFQSGLIKDLKRMFPGCIVMKNDSSYIQGIPDLLLLYKDKWASLEVKQNSRAKKRPNQEYYVGQMNEMSFSRFIYPENKEEVLDELFKAFKS
jgi:hypothetical protein